MSRNQINITPTVKKSATAENVRRYWSIVVLFIMLAPTILGLFEYNSGNTQQTIPNLIVSEAIYDFGLIPADAPVVHNFTLWNTGTADLTLTNPTANAADTSVILANTTIPANGDGSLEVTFDPQGQSGQITRIINFTTNDPARPTVDLRITAVITP